MAKKRPAKGDFARGKRTKPTPEVEPDYARGKREEPTPEVELDYARGKSTKND
jgi:hypothetical protein